MGTRNTVEYVMRQHIKLANGQERVEKIGQGLGNEAIDRLVALRDKYVADGFDVELVRITQRTKTEIIDT